VTISPDDLVLVVAIAAGSSATVGLVVWGLTVRVRRRSLRASLVCLAILCVCSVLAGVVATARAMFLSAHDLAVTGVVAVVTGFVVLAAALLVSRQLSRDHRLIGEAAQALAAGDAPQAATRRLTGELEGVRQQLVDASTALSAGRAREKAMADAQRELFTALSHDLRTPLASLRAMVEALQDGLVQDPARYHDRMHYDVDRLTAMVTSLLQLANRELVSPSMPVSLPDLVSDCLAGMEATATARGVALHGHAAASTEVVGDGSALARALDNVVANAVAATGRGGSVQIRLDQVARSAGRPDLARLTVSDTCGGIADADLARVFQVGFRGSGPSDLARGADGGTGLGLAVTRQIVQAHGGSITVGNTGVGCRFTIELPAADPVWAAPSTDPGPRQPAPEVSGRSNR